MGNSIVTQKPLTKYQVEHLESRLDDIINSAIVAPKVTARCHASVVREQIAKGTHMLKNPAALLKLANDNRYTSFDNFFESPAEEREAVKADAKATKIYHEKRTKAAALKQEIIDSAIFAGVELSEVLKKFGDKVAKL